MNRNDLLSIEKGLINNNDQSKYDNLVKIYKYLLEYYINSKVDLYKYDNFIKNSNLYIGINEKYKTLNEYLKLDYVFLINNLFVEKLSLEDINLLTTKFSKDNINMELVNIVERTYKDVIYDNFLKGEYQNNVYYVCYGPVIPSNFVDNNSLVFKIYYGKNTINKEGKEFIELHEKQLDFINQVIEELKNEVKEKLNVNCFVLLEKDIY